MVIGRLLLAVGIGVGTVCAAVAIGADITNRPTSQSPELPDEIRQRLDAPLLFTRRHSYSGIHIYDTFYKWPPGGGGIYILENPAEARADWRIRPVIDPTTPDTLGEGVYTHPELSFDATRLLFCFKGSPEGSTSIYEIGVDGKNLRRITDPTVACDCYKGSKGGQHDISPAYLPDGRIVFISTRPSGLVPCNNTGVAILHVVNADGSDMHPISVNTVNEFDPTVLPDGRILFGRWEYVDKNALTIQSLWTIRPDGTQETAFFANNMVFPEAILDARPVLGSHLVVGSFTKHNSTPRGSIALIDPHKGKNGLQAIHNIEHPDRPDFDQGDSCQPWPLDDRTFLVSGRPSGSGRNVIEWLDRDGRRGTVLSDPAICMHAPMLVKPRPDPVVLPDMIQPKARTGRFFVQDIYRGLTGVKPGEVKWLRVVEETSRISPRSGGKNPYNQTFLVSSALAFSVKNFMGVVPVEEDGSAYFEVPAGRAIYLQALDANKQLVQSMRTFVQASPGTTRSCVGCHEEKTATSVHTKAMPPVLGRDPSQLEEESWGSGYLDYASMVQPVLDRNCVRCHGGEKGMGNGMDLSGGWTEHFNISYENLSNRCETQLIAHWIAGIDCMNGTALWSAQRFPPRSHGSGAAPLGKLLVSGHHRRLKDLTPRDRDLLMAWIDTNGLYYGTWDQTPAGSTIAHWGETRQELVNQMKVAGCLECHGNGSQIGYFENDWINLEYPKRSRILRAPLARPEYEEDDPGSMALDWCRDRKVTPDRQRVHLLWRGYAHAVQPPEAFPRREWIVPSRGGPSSSTFESTRDPNYQAMLAIIRESRERALASPRIDMPGADVVAGECRLFLDPPVPEQAPAVGAEVDADGVVHLHWKRSSGTIGLLAQVHRGDSEDFTPDPTTELIATPLSYYVDREASVGSQTYALVLYLEQEASQPTRVTIDVPPPVPPAPPTDLSVSPSSGSVDLAWQPPTERAWGYHVYRRRMDVEQAEAITPEPIRQARYIDLTVESDVTYVYTVRAVSRRGALSEPSTPLDVTPKIITEPMLTLETTPTLQGRLHDGAVLPVTKHGKAGVEGAVLDFREGGHLTLPHQDVFDVCSPLTVAFWIRFEQAGDMPVMVGSGHWNHAGWFVQRLGNHWRWHVGGLDCDGGTPVVGQWVHLTATYDGQTSRLYENGKSIASITGPINTAAWPGAFHIGQYSGGPDPSFQVTGQIADVRFYHRALPEADAARLAETPP